MDMNQIARLLIETHTKQTNHAPKLLRTNLQSAYAKGVHDAIRALQEQAIAQEFSPQVIEAPLAVSPNHVAEE